MNTAQGEEITRQIFWNVYSGQGLNLTQVALYAVLLVTVAVFIYGLKRSGFLTRRQMWRLGQGADLERTDKVSRRLSFSLAEIFGHR